MKDRDPFHEIRVFYNTEYHCTSRFGSRGLPWHTRRIAASLGTLKGKCVLDVGCGTGEWLVELAGKGARVAGVDVSEHAILICMERFKGGEFVASPAEQLPFSDGQFDLVTCLGSLEHFINKPKALAEMRRVATSKAIFLILVPNAGFPTRRLGLFHGTEQTRVREDVLTLDAWQKMFRDAGFVVVKRRRDLHVLSLHWINRGSLYRKVLRAVQAIALAIWPIRWQYQVYFFCVRAESTRQQ